MTPTLKIQDFHTFGKDFVLAVHHIKAQHRTELFHGIGAGHASPPLPGYQDSGVRRHSDSGKFRKVRRGFSHCLRIHRSVRSEQDGSQLFSVFVRQEAVALPPGLRHNLFLLGTLNDKALLGGADRAVVKGFRPGDLGKCLGNIRTVVKIGRAVPGSHADGGLAGGIGRFYHTGAAGGKNQPHRLRTHQLLTTGKRRNRQALNASRRSTGGLRCLRNDFHRRQSAVQRLGVGRKYDGVSRLQGNDGLIAHGGGRVGAGDDGGDHPHRHADFPNYFLRTFSQKAYGFHAPHRLCHGFRGKAVLGGFIRHVAKARFFHGKLCQSRRLGGECGSDCLHDGIQLFLGKIRQKMLSLFRLSGQIPCLLPGSQILVKFHIFSP